jgi:transcriptional regulator with XRE-family HTH domain
VAATSDQAATMGVRLIELRKRAGMAREQLVVRAGLASATVRRVESNDIDPRLSTIRKLAAALGVEPGAPARARVVGARTAAARGSVLMPEADRLPAP